MHRFRPLSDLHDCQVPPCPGYPLPPPQVNWGVDLTEGKATDPWKNAQLSSEAKDRMWELHSQQG